MAFTSKPLEHGPVRLRYIWAHDERSAMRRLFLWSKKKRVIVWRAGNTMYITVDV